MGFLTTLLHSQLFVTPPYPTHDFTGQTAIVTGSNVGLGYEAAKHIARLNCKRLIIAVRNLEKGEKAKREILASLSSPREDDFVKVWQLDLASTQSTKDFAERASSELDRVDVLLENAGIDPSGQWHFAEGHEQSLTVNVLNTLLLGLLLLPKLRETSQKFNTKARLSIVTSELHHVAAIPKDADFDHIYATLDDKSKSNIGSRYQETKLLEVLLVRQLASFDRYANPESTPVIINLVNPGMCTTEFGRNLPFLTTIMFKCVAFFLARTAEVGGRTLVAGAAATERNHGEYMADSENQDVVAWIRTAEGKKVQEAVWKQTVAVLEGWCPGIEKNV